MQLVKFKSFFFSLHDDDITHRSTIQTKPKSEMMIREVSKVSTVAYAFY